MECRFAIKTNYKQDFSTFYDLYSDFSAMLDGEGIALVKEVFRKKGRGYSAKEQSIADILLNKKVIQSIEEIGAYAVPSERNGTALQRVEIEITKRCNLQCQHCFTEKAASDIETELIARIVPELLALGVVEIVLNGGEPFAHSKIEKILATIAGKFKIIVYSNGLLLDDDKITLLRQYHPAKINISLDGFQESHEYLRGTGTYEKTTAVIRKLTGMGMRVQINTVVFPANAETIEKFIVFCQKELRACGVKLSTIYPLGNARSHPNLLETSKTSDEIYEKYLEEDLPGIVRGKHLPCAAGVTQLFINTYGELYPCRLFEGPQCKIGDLTKYSLPENYQRFLNTPSYFTDFQLDNLISCVHCSALSVCKTGCRARAYLLQKDLHAPDTFACQHYLLHERKENNHV